MFEAVKVSVVVPARNEAPTIAQTIDRAAPYAHEIIVVDGHSTDGTRDIARGRNVRVVTDNGLGKGDAIRVGIAEARGDVIVFIDADGSHDAADIPRLVEPIARGEADLVVGSRMLGGSDELHGDVKLFLRLMGSNLITLGVNYRFGVRLTDTQNGFRAIRTDAARRLNLVENITTIEQEMGIKVLHAGMRVLEVPSHEYRRQHGTSSIRLRRVWFSYVSSCVKHLMFGARTLDRAPR